MADVDYSRVAAFYQWFEKAVFASTLQRVRCCHLAELATEMCSAKKSSPMRVLLVGDGDGRFLVELLKAVPDIHIDYVDCSWGMIEQAQQRVDKTAQIRWVHADFMKFDGAGYDLVVAHFFLDQFTQPRLGEVLDKLVASLALDGRLLVSDFDKNAHWPMRLLVCTMQCFFSCCAGLSRGEVARVAPMLEARSLKISFDKSFWAGGIYSQIWKM